MNIAHATTLARWVGDPAAFAAGHWRRRPGIFTPDGPLASPFTLTDVDDALATGFLHEPYLEMTGPEGPFPPTPTSRRAPSTTPRTRGSRTRGRYGR